MTATSIVDKALSNLAKKKLIDKAPELDLETKVYLAEITCPVTLLMATSGPTMVGKIEAGGVGTNFDLKTEEVSLGWKKVGSKWSTDRKLKHLVAEKEISDTWTTKILLKDDMSGNDESFLDFVMNTVKRVGVSSLMNWGLINPLDDSDITMADKAQAERMAKDLQYVQGEALPQSYATDFNMQTDESFSRIFFHGLAAPLMAKSDEVTDPEHLKYGPFMIDLTFMGGLKLRSDMYKKYGARIHFDENQVVSAIYECDSEKLYLPGEPGWEEAKLVAKSAVFTLCTVREHLAQTHLIVSNPASREVILNLHPEHPIRRLLAIFTYNAVSINLKAFGVLVPEYCAIHRGTPLDYKGGFRPVFDNAYATSRAFEPFSKQTIKNPAVQKLADEGRFPYLTEGSESYEVIRKMVTAWLAAGGDAATDEYALNFYEAMKESTKGQDYELPEYSHENMIDMISMICFTVTCYHELIGTVPDYTDGPFKAGLRIPKSNPTQIDLQATLIGYSVTASTSVPAPKLLAEFPNYIGAGGAPAWERDVWTDFCGDLKALSEKVKAADEARDFEFKYFDPARYECSVSV